MRWYLIVILIFISMINGLEHFFVYLFAIHVSVSVKYLFMSFPHFSDCQCLNGLYLYVLQISSPSLWLFTFL